MRRHGAVCSSAVCTVSLPFGLDRRPCPPSGSRQGTKREQVDRPGFRSSRESLLHLVFRGSSQSSARTQGGRTTHGYAPELRILGRKWSRPTTNGADTRLQTSSQSVRLAN